MSDVSGVGNTGGQGQAPAGWYTVEDQQRYWDGAQWTDHVAPLPGQADQGQSAVAGFDSNNQSAQPGGQQPFGQQQDFGQQQAQQPFGQQQAAQPGGQQQAYGQQQQQPFGQQQDFGQQQAQQPFGQQQAAQPGGQQQAYGQPSASSGNDTSMAMIAHLGGIIGGFVPSLIIWLIKKDESQFVARHALSALNFQLIVLAGYIALFVFTIVNAFIGIPFIGRLLWLALWLGPLVFSVLGGIAANKGEEYKYPVDVKIIK